ncbi:hypothetical protein LCGC14_1163260 [marine sediment metagenome]|uniref:Uncharacterized protein n=1 Tax=marine sediment metagenome TaxID=412755 RepID=A0A0F9PXK7_9ZZZZ
MPYTDSPLIDDFRRTIEENLPEDETQALLPKFNKTKLLLTDMKFRNLNKGNWIAFIDGKGGTGKSSIMRFLFQKHKKWLYETKEGQELIDYWNKEKKRSKPVLDMGAIIYNDYEFLDRCGKAVPLEIIVKDEDFETSAQVGGKAMKERKLMLLSRIRAEILNFILIDPIFRDDQISGLYTYRFFAHDKDFEDGKNRAILYLQDYTGHWQPIGHIITDYLEWPEYDEKKNAYLAGVKQMQSPEYKRKQIKKIVDAMVHWKTDGHTDDIRAYQKNAWNGIIKLRLDLMELGGQRAGTEIKEIKDMIDAYYPIKKEKKKKN